MNSIKILTLNARGLKNRLKRISLFHQIRKLRCDIVCLQETHITPSDSQLWEKEWGGQIVYVQGTGNSRGEMILFGKNTPLTLEIIHKEYKIIILSIRSDNFTCAVCNVYAANNKREKINYFDRLLKLLDRCDINSLMLLGDFNTIMNNDLDIVSGKPHSVREVTAVSNLVNELMLTDAWRLHHGKEKKYTWSRICPFIDRRLE